MGIRHSKSWLSFRKIPHPNICQLDKQLNIQRRAKLFQSVLSVIRKHIPVTAQNCSNSEADFFFDTFLSIFERFLTFGGDGEIEADE